LRNLQRENERAAAIKTTAKVYNAAESVHLGEDGRQKIAAVRALKALGSSTYLVLILAAISQKSQVNMCT
jgi:hypothetical protein